MDWCSLPTISPARSWLFALKNSRGLAAWGRVRDYRLQQLHQMPNVELFPASRLTAENVLEFGFPRVVLATGCRWRKDKTRDKGSLSFYHCVACGAEAYTGTNGTPKDCKSKVTSRPL